MHVERDQRQRRSTTLPAQRLQRLFKVLVVGGVIAAAAYASALQGPTGAATADSDGGSDGGGAQGW